MANGDEYVGEFDHGIRQGQGTFTFGPGEFEGEKFVGEFKGGMWTGTWYNASGNVAISEGEEQ